MKLPIDVSPDGKDTFRIVVTSRDVSLWERIGKKPRKFGDGGISELEEITHLSCQRQGLWHGTIQEFREQCDIDPLPDEDDDEDDEDRPTLPAQ